MHRWASRIDLEVVSVRVERVQDISEADAQREGWCFQGLDLNQSYDPVWMDTARRWYQGEWDRINGKPRYVKGAGFGGATKRVESPMDGTRTPGAGW